MNIWILVWLILCLPSGLIWAQQDRSVTIILIDGLGAPPLERALELGQLPNIKKLMKNSLYVRSGIASFPSMTGYAFYPFLTGVSAAQSGVLGLRWFDRNRKVGNLRNYVGRSNVQMNHDLNPRPATLFERVAPAYTSSINSYMNRGVQEAEMTGWAHTTAKYPDETFVRVIRQVPFIGEDMAKDHFQHETLVTDMAIEQLKKNPKVQWITYPSMDASNHVEGTSMDYFGLLRHIDAQIGRLLQAIEANGQSGQRALAIISDHGVSDVYENVDVCGEIQKLTGLTVDRGKALQLWNSAFTKPISDYRNLDGFFVINGNLSGMLYLRPKNIDREKTWGTRLGYQELRNFPTPRGKIDFPKVLTKMQGIEHVILRKNAAQYEIHSAKGIATVSIRGDKASYTIQGKDPLGYDQQPSLQRMMDGQFWPLTQWQQESMGTDYPDALYRLAEVIQHPDCGDLLLTSQAGYDLAKDYEAFVNNYRGGHGGFRRDQLIVPYILYAPGMTAREIPYQRAEDFGRAIFEYLGIKPE